MHATLALLLPLLAPHQRHLAPAPSAPDARAAAVLHPSAPDDAELRALWRGLSPDDRREVVDYLDLDLAHAESFQLTLARWALSGCPVDPGLLPEAREPRWYDPERHAPAQPIPRQLLEPDSKRVLAARRAMAASFPARPAAPAYVYDWGARQVVRAGDPDDPTRRFEVALAGLPREHDLVEALVLSWLDDGAQSAVLDAFDRLYTDREGRVYPGITLYDAWGSGASIEMPDVDTLGLLHTIADDWDSFRAPVPSARQEPLYRRLGEWFTPARRHRGLREALAGAYLVAEPAYRDGYTAGNTVGFHALWNRHSSVPHQLAPELPAAADWEAWLAALNAELADDRQLWNGGTVRRDTLARDQALVRSRLVAVLGDLGLLAPARSGREPSGQ